MDPSLRRSSSGARRRAVGAWTKTSVLELLANPKYTGYMVWNRRKRSRPERGIPGRVNLPGEWVWSRHPTHEPLVTRALFDAAVPVARLRRGSRTGAGANHAHPETSRSYLLRSYVVCDICGRRMFGKTRRRREREYTYYACVTIPEHHREQPWFGEHPKTLMVREDLLLPVVGEFFAERVLGEGRKLFLPRHAPGPQAEPDTGERGTLRARLEQLSRAQTNLLAQLEAFQPTGDPGIDAQWRTQLQRRFATIATERRTATERLERLDSRQPHTHAAAEDPAALLDLLPCTGTDLTLLPDADQRRLYDAFHLQARYHRTHHRLTLSVTVSAATARSLGIMLTELAGDHADTTAPTADDGPRGAVSHAVGAPDPAPYERAIRSYRATPARGS